MQNPARKLAFVLAATEQGSMIVNRLDFHQTPSGTPYGIGHQLLETGAYDPGEIDLAMRILDLRRHYSGDGVVAVDCGANIGIHSVSWGRRTTGWAKIYAIEAQERIFYALAGNIALNNCFNVQAIHAAVGAADGDIRIPTPDYLSPANFGGLELHHRAQNEFIGQKVDYAGERLTPVRMIALDGLKLPRCDFLKIDVEGMEVEVLDGAEETIAEYKPVILAEYIKAGRERLTAALERHGYAVHGNGINLLAVHPTDRVGTHVRKAAPKQAPAPDAVT